MRRSSREGGVKRGGLWFPDMAEAHPVFRFEMAWAEEEPDLLPRVHGLIKRVDQQERLHPFDAVHGAQPAGRDRLDHLAEVFHMTEAINVGRIFARPGGLLPGK